MPAKKARGVGKSTRPGKAAAPKPRVVRAWFDTVINPLLGALDHERELLARENWTWRFSRPGLESIRPLALYVEYKANLEHFFGRYAVASKTMTLHDKRVDHLRDECRRFHEALKKHDKFRELYYGTTEEGALSKMGLNLSSLFGAYPPEHHLDVLAEYVVNNIRFLPDYYAPAPYWNHYKDQFLAIRNQPSVEKLYGATRQAGSELRVATERLVSLLREARLELSDQSGEPFQVAQPTGFQAYDEGNAYPPAY